MGGAAVGGGGWGEVMGGDEEGVRREVDGGYEEALGAAFAYFVFEFFSGVLIFVRQRGAFPLTRPVYRRSCMYLSRVFELPN